MRAPTHTLDFGQIRLRDLPLVGGKNASLGELFNALAAQGVGALDGFALTTAAYRRLLATDGLEERLRAALADLDTAAVAERATHDAHA